jgi:hypothetical protein
LSILLEKTGGGARFLSGGEEVSEEILDKAARRGVVVSSPDSGEAGEEKICSSGCSSTQLVLLVVEVEFRVGAAELAFPAVEA